MWASGVKRCETKKSKCKALGAEDPWDIHASGRRMVAETGQGRQLRDESEAPPPQA